MDLRTIVAVLIPVLAGPAHGAGHRVPIERMLAGYSIGKTEPVALRDARTGCYFVRTGE